METVSGYQGQKREGLLRLYKSGSLIYTHSHAELWTLNWAQNLRTLFNGDYGARSPPDAARPEMRRAGLAQRHMLCSQTPRSSRGYKTFPSPSTPLPLPSGLAPGRSCGQLSPTHLSEGCGARMSNTFRLQGGPCPRKQQRSGNKQLRITCSPRLTSHAACQPPRQWRVLVRARDTAAQKPSFPSHPSRVLSYCFPAPVSNWRLAYQLFDTHWSTEKGNLLPEQRNRRKKE